MRPAQADRVYLGWQYATPHPDPGPPPRRPTPPEAEQLSPDWAAAQRREENLLNRPLKAALGVAVVIGAAAVVLGVAGWLPMLVAGLGVVICVLIAAVCGYAVWQGERALRSRIDAERRRVSGIRAQTERRLFTGQAEHAARVRAWQAHRAAYEQQQRWYPVTAPPGVWDAAQRTRGGKSATVRPPGRVKVMVGVACQPVRQSGGPWEITAPATMTATRSAMCRTTAKSCAMNR